MRPGSCARATADRSNGTAAALAMSVMNSRRLIALSSDGGPQYSIVWRAAVCITAKLAAQCRSCVVHVTSDLLSILPVRPQLQTYRCAALGVAMGRSNGREQLQQTELRVSSGIFEGRVVVRRCGIAKGTILLQSPLVGFGVKTAGGK
jgi:hypothetical protein